MYLEYSLGYVRSNRTVFEKQSEQVIIHTFDLTSLRTILKDVKKNNISHANNLKVDADKTEIMPKNDADDWENIEKIGPSLGS